MVSRNRHFQKQVQNRAKFPGIEDHEKRVLLLVGSAGCESMIPGSYSALHSLSTESMGHHLSILISKGFEEEGLCVAGIPIGSIAAVETEALPGKQLVLSPRNSANPDRYRT